MSIKFKSNHPNVSDVLIIGGKDDAFTGEEKGGYGPFPSYSISREDLSADDGTYLNTKYTINITGKATIKPDDTSSALTKGERQSRVMGEDIGKLQFNRNQFPMLGNGVLTVAAYASGGDMVFNDARLLSVNIPEKTEESAGLHYTDYSFVFEAYNLADHNQPDECVSSVQESWELSVNEGRFCYQTNLIDQDTKLFKTYTLTHNLSAVGVRKYTGSSLDADGESWRQAAKWVNTRKIDEPTSAAIAAHINNQVEGPTFHPFYMNSEEYKDDLKTNLVDNNLYKAYNPVRNASVDITGAGYNITESWVLSIADTLALHTVQATVDSNQDSGFVTVTVNGSVTGLNTNYGTSGNNADNRYTNAKTEGEVLIAGTLPFTVAQKAYSDLNTNLKAAGQALNDTILSKSVGRNKNTGEITWSLTYNDDKILGDKSVIASENVQVNYGNANLNESVVAILPVLNRAAGPIIQSFPTANERKQTVNIDLVFKKTHRPDEPPTSYGEALASEHEPQGAFVNSRTESWNKKTGAYNLTIEWIYK